MHDRDFPVVDTSGHTGALACELQSHDGCDASECEVARYHELYEQLTDRSIKIGYWTAITGISISAIFALCILIVWFNHAMAGSAMPAIPLVITSIASAPFAAGVITTLRIPKKARVKWEQK